MSALICVVRHGETDWNKHSILQGSLDIPLNDTGREQAQALATRFADCSFAAIYSSPLSRAFETAVIIAATLDLPPPTPHPGVQERHFGWAQGIPKAELADIDPLLCEQIHQRNPAAHFEGGETLDQFADRVLAGLSDIAERHVGERCLLVTHGWVMDVITRHVQGVARDQALPIKRKNGESMWLLVGVTAVAEVSAPSTIEVQTAA